MAHSPPEGKEKQVLAKVSAQAIKLNELFTGIHVDFGCASIEIGHAREGVRTNGHERTNTVLDVVEKADEMFGRYQRELRELQRVEQEVINIINRIRFEVDKLPLCPSCKGMKGYGRNGMPPHWEKGSQVAGGMAIKMWEDCGVCGGRGIIP